MCMTNPQFHKFKTNWNVSSVSQTFRRTSSMHNYIAVVMITTKIHWLIMLLISLTSLKNNYSQHLKQLLLKNLTLQYTTFSLAPQFNLMGNPLKIKSSAENLFHRLQIRMSELSAQFTHHPPQRSLHLRLTKQISSN